MKKIMLVLSCLIFLNIVAGKGKKDLSVEERQLLLERAALFYEYNEDKKAQAQFNRNLAWKDDSNNFTLMDYFLSEAYVEKPDNGISDYWTADIKDQHNNAECLSYRKKKGLVEEFSVYTLEKSQNSITPDKYNTHVAHYEARCNEDSPEVKTINSTLAYKKREPNNRMATNFSDDILSEAKRRRMSNSTAAHESIIKRNPDRQFVERWACPKVFYPFAWLIYGERVAQSKSWFWSSVKSVEYYEQEAKKVKKDSLAEQFRDQYRAKLGYFDNTKMSSLVPEIRSGLSQNLPYDGLREHAHEFYVALDSFNKLVKNADACDAIKKKRQIVGSRFDGYVTNKDSYDDYRVWKIVQKVTDKDAYSFKAFYNAHEELTRTAKILTDFWVRDKTEELNKFPVTDELKTNIENQKRMLQEKHADMFQALQRYGVNQQILQKIGFEEKKNDSENVDNVEGSNTSFSQDLYRILDGHGH